MSYFHWWIVKNRILIFVWISNWHSPLFSIRVELGLQQGSAMSIQSVVEWVDSRHTHNFWYLYYALILIPLSFPYYSYSKIEELILLIFNNTHDVVDFDSPWIGIYTKYKISMIRIRILQYSVESCVFALLSVFSFFFFLTLSMQQQLTL